MKIDFKGYKYAVVTIQGGVLYRGNDHAIACNFCTGTTYGHGVEENPDYKEGNQMDSIYTQEMYEVGELPKVGMDIEFKREAILEDYKKGFVVGFSKDGEWLYFHDDKNCVSSQHVERGIYTFRPTDTRTNKEKAIDDLDSLFKDLRNASVDNNSVSILRAIINGEIHGVTFTENKND